MDTDSSEKRQFSSLNRIKSELHSTMPQEQLSVSSALSIRCMENESD